MPTPAQVPVTCDIFCAVIDNLGDAGVCWRLARQLATEHGWRVRLWIDDPAPIELLAPGQRRVEVRHWAGDFTRIAPADVVIEAFACTLPPAYLQAMAARPRPPVWLNLEYLSAEDWVAGCHGLPSPQAGLHKHFFFPGYVAGTGGLLRERDFAVPPAPTSPQGAGRHAVAVPSAARDSALPNTFGNSLEVSLFCYDTPQLSALLELWRDGTEDLACHVAEGLPRAQVAAWLGEAFAPGTTARRGRLTLHALPFLPQTEYDRLLGRCQLNFVRGEDSCVRAQWAERPFVWQAYRQADDAHLVKLDAMLDLYCAGLDAASATAVRAAWLAWNGPGDMASAWPHLRAALPALTTHAPGWSQQIQAHGDLATNLVKFCTCRL